MTDEPMHHIKGGEMERHRNTPSPGMKPLQLRGTGSQGAEDSKAWGTGLAHLDPRVPREDTAGWQITLGVSHLLDTVLYLISFDSPPNLLEDKAVSPSFVAEKTESLK